MSDALHSDLEPVLGLPDGELRLREWSEEWPGLFEQEQTLLVSELAAQVLAVEHIGSTSVPGLVAKPVLDILVGAESFESARSIVPSMERLGYKYKGENGIPRRHYFVKGTPRTHHVHVFEVEDNRYQEHLAFRDALRAHVLLRDAYAMLKRSLLHSVSREVYQEGKSEFIHRVQNLRLHPDSHNVFPLGSDEVTIRRFHEDDNISEITALLHRAYKQLADLDLHFWASWQDDAITKDRIESGECFVATMHDQIIGTITCYGPHVSAAAAMTDRDSVTFGQFAVEPRYQGTGLGSRLLDIVEHHAKDLGFRWMLLDTAEPARHLIEYYSRKGYSIIEHVQWDRVNYPSVVMRRELL